MKRVMMIFMMGTIMLANSCVVDYWETSDFIYTNDSEHKIQIKGCLNQELRMDIQLALGTTESIRNKHEAGIFMFDLANVIFVTYDDTIIIQHGVQHGEYGYVKKDLILASSYNIVSTGEHQQRCEYTFTNEDYEEALLLHQSEE